jgi:predicted metal-dependent enzyme (double-stranded beta helix superfamily)
MPLLNPVVERFRCFVRGLADAPPGALKPEEALSTLAADLRQLSASVRWDESPYRPALGSEELVYEIARAGEAGPALYLVSDGVGTSSPPHEHLTWAVIVGISGVEVNVRYELVNVKNRLVRPTGRAFVAGGDVLVLDTGAIHSTLVAGPTPTYHLHLYGKPLESLPPFPARRYDVDAA